MKILNDKDYNVLKAKANLADGILGAITEANADFDTENATAETVLQELADNSSDNSSELQQANSTITELENQVAEHETTIAERDETIAQLNQRVEELSDEPGGDSAGRIPKPNSDAGTSLEEVVAFTDKHDLMENIERVRPLLQS